MSLRDYAKRREALGLVGTSAMAVSKAVKGGRLVKSVVRDHLGHPKIADPALADLEWANGTDHTKAPTAVKERAAVRPPAAAAPRVPHPPAPIAIPGAPPRPPGEEGEVEEPETLNLSEESARVAFWKAHLAELDYRKRAGELVEAKDLEGRLAGVFTGCKTKLLGVPSRARQQDPTLTPAHLALFEELIREALEDLASAADEQAPDPEPARAEAGAGP